MPVEALLAAVAIGCYMYWESNDSIKRKRKKRLPRFIKYPSYCSTVY